MEYCERGWGRFSRAAGYVWLVSERPFLVAVHHVAMHVLLAQVYPCLVIRVAAVEKAEAEKIAVVKAAEGDAESKYLQGQVSIPECYATLQQTLDNVPCALHQCRNL